VLEEVYAPDDRLRIFFHTENPQARGVPEPLKNRRPRLSGRKARSRLTTAGRDHESREALGGARPSLGGENRLENLQTRADTAPRAGLLPDAFR
jgi:hypothetical protein